MFRFIGRHWRGEFGLWKGLILFTVALPLFLLWLIPYVQAFLSLETPPRPRIIIGVGLTLLFAAAGVWQLVGTWRASGAGRSGGRNFVVRWVVRLMAIASAAVAAVFVAIMPSGVAHLHSIANDTDEIGKTGYKLEVAGDRLSLNGAVTWRMHDEFLAALEANPGIKRVVLHSPGGQTAVGHRLAARIRDRQLDTMTMTAGTCASACTLMFGAGVRRILGRGARLGFHSNAPTFTKDEGASFLVKLNQEKDRAFWSSMGAPEAFIKRVEDTPSSDLWFPTLKELREAKVVTDLE